MPTERLTFRLSKKNRDKVNKIAETLDCTYDGKGSIPKLLKAIADNKIILSKNLSNTP